MSIKVLRSVILDKLKSLNEITIEDLDFIFKKYNKHIFKNELKNIAVGVNNRYKTTLAVTMKFHYNTTMLIELNPILFKKKNLKILMEVIEHELIHVLEFRKYRKLSHSKRWHQLHLDYLKKPGSPWINF